jgi:hypothetical protein
VNNVTKENSVMIEMVRQEQHVCEHDDKRYVLHKENEPVQHVNQQHVPQYVKRRIVEMVLLVPVQGSFVMMGIQFHEMDVQKPVQEKFVEMVSCKVRLVNNVMIKIPIISIRVPTLVCFADVGMDGSIHEQMSSVIQDVFVMKQ